MASLANTLKTMQVSLEKKCADLESRLSAKSKSLDTIEEKLRSSEENMTLIIDKKDKQYEELTSYKSANEDLKVQLLDLDKKLKESEAKYRVVVDRINYYESAEYTAKVIDIFHGSPEYDNELFVKSNSFFD